MVSYKLFALIGSDMQKFRKELTESPVPANLLTVIKKLIPPKDIRRNLDGSKLLDYVEDNPYVFEEEDGNAIDDTSDESGSDDEHSDVKTQAGITPTVEVATTANSSNTLSGKKKLGKSD